MANKTAIADASVFLSNASVGNKTATDGTFTLYNAKNGQYDMVVSCVGYETYHRTVMVNNANINLPVIEMVPKVTMLSEVRFAYDKDRDKHVKIFLEEFFGHSLNAAECKLLNPDVLDIAFEKKTGKLTAGSSDFLIIENRALGYRVKYLLKSFVMIPRTGYISYTGSSLFEPLTGKTSEQKRWVRNRITAYRGSDMHFLRSCLSKTVEDEGFIVRKLIRKPTDRPADSVIKAKLDLFRNEREGISVYSDSIKLWTARSRMPYYEQTLVNTPLSSVNYIKLTGQKGIYAFGYPDLLHISYKKTERVSVVTFVKEYAFFDNNGIIVTPESTTFEGYWGFLRVADLLPVDYELPTTF